MTVTGADEVSIRRADDRDVDAMAELALSAYQMYVERMGRRPAPMTADYRHAVQSRHAWIAQYRDEVVGLLVLAPAGDHLLLENVAVAPEAQGVGIGRRLLLLAEDEARALGLGQVRLFTNEAMTENHDYYVRRGYRETHRATCDGFQRVYFIKSLG